MLKAILVDCIPLSMSRDAAEFRLEEAESLVSTFGGIVLVKSIQKRLIPNYRTFIGTGKLDELVAEGQTLGANILIVNAELKAQQVYNISELLRKGEAKMQVWDRIDLILKIFQKHATTKEAKLEIELASIKHMGPRIFGMGMELSRQGGGVGTSGIGETNNEIMKRHLKEQERKILKDIQACAQSRQLHQDARKRKQFKTVSIIGYTNAGKSSLLNALTKKGAYAADKLFATLDTRVGKVYLESVQKELLLSDTIGFIQDLPTTLIQSFHSTLAETVNAEFLLHVIDINDPHRTEKIQVVHDVLQAIGCEDKPMIYVFNKMDQYKGKGMKTLLKKYSKYYPVCVSAKTAKGLAELKEVLGKRIYL